MFLPPGKTGNVFRGALGNLLREVSCRQDCPGARSCSHREQCAYARFFEPRLEDGPSGLADPPRPFVLRPHVGEGRRIARGQIVSLHLHLFDVRTPFIPYLIAALRLVAESGLGPGRGRAALESVFVLDEKRDRRTRVYGNGRMLVDRTPGPVLVPLTTAGEPAGALRIRFASPTEIKADGHTVQTPEFRVLIARLRDRVATLDSLYGAGQVAFEWKAMEEAAAHVRIAAASLREQEVERRSSRTGLVHPIGGFTGDVDYEGEIGPFLPLLRAGRWTGVGRQTVWGKGAYDF